VTRDRIAIAVGCVMRENVILVLFDDPYVDVEAAAFTVGSPYV
jgi:hypothetical protein